MLSFDNWLEGTQFSNWLRYSPFPFPLLIMTHVVTITVFAGTAIVGNLRVLGLVMRDVPATEVFDQFRKWKWISFSLLLVSGILITISDPVEYYTNPMYWISLAALLVAAVNAWTFHNGIERSMKDWENNSVAPPAARRWAICSLVLWISSVGIGRAIAFF